MNAVVFVDGKPAILFNQVLTFGRALLTLGVYLALVLAAGLTSFRVRDVD